MITTSEILKNYIEEVIKGNDIGLENYVREIFKGQDKTELRRYCKEQEIYYKKASTRERVLQKIYGSCNTGLSYKLLMTSDVTGESEVDYYKRIYARDYISGVFNEF